MDVTTEKKHCLLSEIHEGKYSLGELIVPIKFKKISVSIDGDLTEDIIKYLCSINEYKYQADDCDIIALKNELKYFQQRRYFMIWHVSTICNHGDVLFTRSEVYENAIHLTDEEVLQFFGKKVDAQETIEQPQIYIFCKIPWFYRINCILLYKNGRCGGIKNTYI